MELILWRHADAEDAGPEGDLARALTPKGQKQARRMGEWLHARMEGKWRIVCSPARRALETAQALGAPFEVREAVSISASADAVLREVDWPHADRVLVVGHQPTLGEVAARLIGGNAGEIAVRKGAVLWFATRERDGGIETTLRVALDPEMLRPA